MKLSSIAFIGITVFACASCSQDIEFAEESQEQLKELSFEHISLKFMETATGSDESSSRKRVHASSHDDRFQYYEWDLGDNLAAISPECPDDHNKGVYSVQSKVSNYGAMTVGLTKQSGGIMYETSKENDPHRIAVGYPAGKVTLTNFGEYNEEYVEGNFTATIDAIQSDTISSTTDTEGYYTVADWNNAIFAGFWAASPKSLLTGGTYIPVYPIFTQLELKMEIPESDIVIKSIKVKAQAKTSEGVKDVAICGNATGLIKGWAGGQVDFVTFTAENATDNQILTLTVDGNKTLSSNDKLKASLFFFPCGDTEQTNHLAEERTEVPFKIQVIVEYQQGDETKNCRAVIDNQNIFLGGCNSINLGKIGGNDTASTKKLTFS